MHKPPWQSLYKIRSIMLDVSERQVEKKYLEGNFQSTNSHVNTDSAALRLIGQTQSHHCGLMVNFSPRAPSLLC